MGKRCGLTGIRVLTLTGKGRPGFTDQAKMEIYDPEDDCNPLLSLKHNTIRCIGKMGKWLYVEVGTRGRGGPGLLWMHFGNKEKAASMKDILYM